jgi:cysteine synthase B
MSVPRDYPTIEHTVGKTPLVRLQRIPGETSNTILGKLEGNNPAGSVKDRPAMSMINEAESRGVIAPGDTLVEATSGNTGIALAMAAAVKGYRLKLAMPSNQSEERKGAMRAHGAELVDVSPEQGMEGARDLALRMQAGGEGMVLNQFANPGNPQGHFATTGPEIWEQTGGSVTHFISSMGTTGTIMGVSRFLKSQNPDVQIIGLQLTDGSQIPGIRRWPSEYLPDIYQHERVDRILDISQSESEQLMKRLARGGGHLCECFFRRCRRGGAQTQRRGPESDGCGDYL